MAQNEESTPKKRRSTKATAKKSTKPAKKSTKKSTKKAPAKREQPANEPTVNPYATFDRSRLKDKMRVFQLAKELNVPSKDLVVALSDMGVVKVAQSSLTRAESEQLLDALSPDTNAPQSSDAGDESSDADEKIRHRVRKDVENEIHQIEDKVNAELATADEPGTDPSGDASDEPLTDVEPDVTPAPEDESVTEYAPLFKAPTRSQRRRARRAAQAARAADREVAEGSDGLDDSDASSSDSGDGTLRTAEGSSADSARSGRQKRNRGNAKASKASDSRGQENADGAERGVDTQEAEQIDEPKAIKGSARLEAKRRRRSERSAEERKRSRIVSQAEFLARRESVQRTMVVRDRERHYGTGMVTQVGVLEDGLLVEHFVDTEDQVTMVGNIYLGRVQNVLPSMEAAFIDYGQGRNGVLYAGEIDWKSAGLGGRARRIENALKSGDQVVVQVTKDPVGHKGARLTTQISLAGRFLVYVPGGRTAGISRKLPAPERKRLKEILHKVVPGEGGAIIRTAAENITEEAIAADVQRLHSQWEEIKELAEREKKSHGAKPVTLYEEPALLIKVVRDLFNEDFNKLIVDGKKSYKTIRAYVESVAPDLLGRVKKYRSKKHNGRDAFETYRVDEQLEKALARKVWLPSGGTLIIEHTEALTVIDVNTGKYTGSGGNLEETVTKNNLEAAEEIVRQIRLRDIGGMIIIDFIDMILPENQELVVRRLKESLGRDRTRHNVSEVTSLGLVQLTRKRLGNGLLETFSVPCHCCDGRGILLTEDPVVEEKRARYGRVDSKRLPSGQHPAARAMHSALSEAPKPVEKPLDDEAIDELADAVVAEEKEKEDEPKTSSRRRGRRGSGRGRGRNRSQSPEQNAPDAEEHRDQRGSEENTVLSSEPAENDGVNEAGSETQQSDGGNERSGRNRRRRRQAQRKNAKAEHSKPVEASGGAFGDADDDNDHEDAPAQRTSRAGRSKKRRSARRAATRSSSIETEAPAQGENENTGNSRQSFEDAVADFEKSPRRRRKTRGNSRSDQRPQRNEWDDDSQASEAQQPVRRGTTDQSGTRDRGASADELTGNRGSVETSRDASGGRRRRRAVRRTNRSESSEDGSAPNPRQDGGRNPRNAGAHEDTSRQRGTRGHEGKDKDSEEHGEEAGRQRSRRGRRRAARKRRS